MYRINVKNSANSIIYPISVSIDDRPIKAKSVKLSHSIDAAYPTCEIEIYSLPDTEFGADIQFRFTPQSVQEAMEIIRRALISGRYPYVVLITSISSALKSLPKESDLEDVAKSIADGIIKDLNKWV